MPTSEARNLIYRAALPVLAPSPRGQMTHSRSGQPLISFGAYERLLVRHHVLGACLLLRRGEAVARVDTSVARPKHIAGPDTLYRVASITKMATALVTLSLVADGAFTLDTPVAGLLPGGEKEPALRNVTVRQLLSHTSGLRDVPAMDAALRQGQSWHEVLRTDGVRVGEAGASFSYCNLAFGLMGCLLEQVTGTAVSSLFAQRLFEPLGMRATLDASGLSPERIMPISRVLRYHRGQDVTVTALGRIPLTAADPDLHFGHTAGAMYTDAPSLDRLLRLILGDGALEGRQLLPETLVREMKHRQASYGQLSPGMTYGLGLVRLEDPKLPGRLILGHQGYAYGCADGAFADEKTGDTVILLNGGCSEAREGRLGLCNRDVLRWALGKELPQWS